ncbi:MAG: leucyl aminopeptidase family protein [Rhizobiaceae bacterium]|nr:leucyl aminopeptidase family protein [Rhizobiaceae bacterium]
MTNAPIAPSLASLAVTEAPDLDAQTVFVMRGDSLPDTLPQAARLFVESAGWPAPGEGMLLPEASGRAGGWLYRADATAGAMGFGTLGRTLPAGSWVADGALSVEEATAALLGAYEFSRYRAARMKPRRLCVGPVAGEALRIASACGMARDMVNTPANDMTPQTLEDEARALALHHGAAFRVIAGDELLDHNFPMIHAVGRAGAIAPRLIDFTWGRSDARKVTLVGKGVCFDTGGLDIKPSSGMLLMKKDMGGAAHVLALARMMMEAKRDVRLRVLIPAVENSIAGNAFRPGDILKSRKGDTVEIGNTDAEGRLILADALALACEEKPDLLIDMATLTGAARVALGPDVIPFYTDDEPFAAALAAASGAVQDPVWRMPLWKPYAAKLASKIADTNNVTTDGFAGSVTAALFLQRFVQPGIAWAHFDIFAWSPAAKPSCPVGAEAQVIRALDRMFAGNA